MILETKIIVFDFHCLPNLITLQLRIFISLFTKKSNKQKVKKLVPAKSWVFPGETWHYFCRCFLLLFSCVFRASLSFWIITKIYKSKWNRRERSQIWLLNQTITKISILNNNELVSLASYISSNIIVTVKHFAPLDRELFKLSTNIYFAT